MEELSGVPAATWLARSGFSAVYLAAYLGIGLYLNYGAVFLRFAGLPVAQIAFLSCLYYACASLSQPLLGRAFDLTRRKDILVATCCLTAAIAGLALPCQTSIAARSAVFAVLAGFGGPVMSLLDAGAIPWCDKFKVSFRGIRLWGSAGIFLSAVFGSVLLGRLGQSWAFYGYATMLSVAAIMLVTLCSAQIIKFEHQGTLERGGVPLSRTTSILASREFLHLALVIVAYRAAFVGPLSFLSVYMDHQGLGLVQIGRVFSVMCLSEPLVMALSLRLPRSFSSRVLFSLAIAATAARWMITAMAADMWPMMLAQGLHGFGQVLFYTAAVERVARMFPPESSGTAQSMLGSLMYGLGPVLGTAIGGILIPRIGFSSFFWLSSGACVACLGASQLSRFLRSGRLEEYTTVPGSPDD